MTIYFGVLEGEGRNWGVWFPDIPGCVGAGTTPDEAISQARSTLEQFDAMDRAEGLVSPAARSADDLSLDADVRDALANGDRLVPFDLGHRPEEIKIGA